MITDKMSDMEIFKEVWSERGAVHGYMERLIPKYRRPIIKSSKFPMYFTPIEFVSRKNNRYLIFFEARNKKDWERGILYTIICLYEKQGGTNVMMFSTVSKGIHIYSPHFFSRYRSRFLKDDSISPLDVIKRFFKINPTATISVVEDSDEFYGTCNEGAAFGKITADNVIVLKTFVSFEMLHDSQEHIKTDIYNDLIKYRAEIQ